jgi:uncharacterized membrane protein YdbT with pleckstrin-like domain
MWQRWARWVNRRLDARRYPELPTDDSVALDQRRHAITLLIPLARTVLGVLAVLPANIGAARLWLFAASVALWLTGRFHIAIRPTLLWVAVPVVVVAMANSPTGRTFVIFALLIWLAEDFANWYTDRLVVTNKRVYRLYGVLTTHSPSIALTAVAFIDPKQPLLGRVFGYGTILLDSAAQRDEPLARFDYLPAADRLHRQILELRWAAIPKIPPIPGLN